MDLNVERRLWLWTRPERRGAPWEHFYLLPYIRRRITFSERVFHVYSTTGMTRKIQCPSSKWQEKIEHSNVPFLQLPQNPSVFAQYRIRHSLLDAKYLMCMRWTFLTKITGDCRLLTHFLKVYVKPWSTKSSLMFFQRPWSFIFIMIIKVEKLWSTEPIGSIHNANAIFSGTSKLTTDSNPQAGRICRQCSMSTTRRCIGNRRSILINYLMYRSRGYVQLLLENILSSTWHMPIKSWWWGR